LKSEHDEKLFDYACTSGGGGGAGFGAVSMVGKPGFTAAAVFAGWEVPAVAVAATVFTGSAGDAVSGGYGSLAPDGTVLRQMALPLADRIPIDGVRTDHVI
jgi:hypothetical protein